MRTAFAASAIALAMAVVCPAPARAQSSTSGALEGTVTDAETGAPLAGVTVVVTGPALKGSQEATTGFDGSYRITELPPGPYLVSFLYGTAVARAKQVHIALDATTALHHKMKVEGLVYEFDGNGPPIDPRDAKRSTRVDRSMLLNGVIPGDGIEGALGIAPGSGNDGLGAGFGGSSSLENRTSIDGMDTTGLTYGQHGLGVPLQFVDQVEIITGGYNAEYGRATGGQILAITRSGSNTVEGDVFTRITPGALVAATDGTPSEASAIDARADLDWQAEAGFDLGGPIVRDRLWYFVGFAPQLERTTITRTTRRLTDCRQAMDDGTLSGCDPEQYADGFPDKDPLTGYREWEPVDSTTLMATSTRLPVMAKLSGALAAEHQGQLSLMITPAMGRSPGVFGAPAATGRQSRQLTSDAVFKWTSKLGGGDTELSTVLGWHRSALRSGSIDGSADDLARENLYYGTLGTWSMLGYESTRTADGCRDGGGGDAYPYIVNCPDEGEGYAIGGPGALTDEVEQRLSARLLGSRRAQLGGNHEIVSGVDVESAELEHLRGISGGALYDIYGGDYDEARILRWVRLAPPADATGFDELCRDSDAQTESACAYLGQDDVVGRTLSTAAFVRDSWQPLPNLTFNVGLRYEQQRLRYAAALQDTVDPFTGNRLGKNAMVLDGMWAPRAGVVWDWTREGRAKAFAHWGRFYEAIPMDINNRSFGGETMYEQRYALNDQCGPADPATGMPHGGACAGTPGNGESVFGSGVLVAPGVRAQYMDEQLAGAEMEVADDTVVGVALQRRTLGRILEDLSVDGAQTYILANPGEWSADAEAALEDQIAGAEPDEAARLQGQLDQFRRIRGFDKPRRDYTALQLTGSRRQGRNLMVQASYTYSHLRGNYPGLFSAENGQIDPNISSQFDLVELLANRDGPLPADRPHYFKLDGYYTRELGKNAVTTGVRLRALSGTPVSALARHYRYGPDESFLLPRGALGRGDVDWGFDLHLGMARKLGQSTSLELYADLFNLFDRQGTFDVVQRYTDDPANPIVGGGYQDLVFAKRQDLRGNETSEPLTRFPGFRLPASRYAPFSARLGARLAF
ncbi:MAG TPA: TonB-dependent receptor [Kofleriaceae bacterium]|nr:TonB-dependent receptor [Kofleriaceae bacterium]